jgi:hypothetical protein
MICNNEPTYLLILTMPPTPQILLGKVICPNLAPLNLKLTPKLP